MENDNQLKPLIKLLNDVIHPDDLARLFDELAYDYSRLSVTVQRFMQEDRSIDVHEESARFLYYLKLLRDTLRECG